MELKRSEIIKNCETNMYRGYYSYLFLNRMGDIVRLERRNLPYIDMVAGFGSWLDDAIYNNVVMIDSFEQEYNFEVSSDYFFDYYSVGNWRSLNLKLLV